MNKLFPALQPQAVELLLDEILHGLDVVVCHSLEVLDSLGVGHREVAVDVAQRLIESGAGLPVGGSNVDKLRQWQFAQGDKIFYFHLHAVADQGVLGKIAVEMLSFAAVAAVDRRDGGELGKLHIAEGM